MNREEIISANPLPDFLERLDIPLKGAGSEKFTTNICAAVEHKPSHQCVNIDAGRGVWHCCDCGEGGSVIDWVMKRDGLSAGDAMAKLACEDSSASALPPSRHVSNGATGKIVKVYDYTDESGVLLFQVARMEPKTFRQRHKGEDGKWVYSMEGVRRVLYNLPAVLKSDFVWIAEGEKDADTLISVHAVGTCNVGGAGKWDDSYTESLRGRDVVLVPDNDDAGGKHADKVQAALAGAAKSVRRIKIPAPHKDVSDWAASFADAARFGVEMVELAERAEVLIGGMRLPIKTMGELEAEYRDFISRASTVCLRLSTWLPSLTYAVRDLVPGEVLTFVAGTGVGKTMLLQNLAINTRLPTLLFEMELPGSLSFERFVAMALNRSGQSIHDSYFTLEPPNWRGSGKLDHIAVCSESRMTMPEFERIINNTGLKTGVRPAVVMLDYIQLIQGKGDRRERISDAAEEIKVIAKATKTIIVIASQIARKGDDSNGEVFLCDGKESGSIENSSGLVIGAWRDADRAKRGRMWLKIMKNTKGYSGKKIACDIRDGLVIVEAATAEQPKD